MNFYLRNSIAIRRASAMGMELWHNSNNCQNTVKISQTEQIRSLQRRATGLTGVYRCCRATRTYDDYIRGEICNYQ